MIRPEAPDDAASIDAVIEAAFGQRDEADLVRALREDAGWLPDLSLVAMEEQLVVGHIALTRATVDGASILALAPLSVRPDRQRLGIGSDLVREALRRAGDAAESVVVVLGDPAYYGRFGFRPARDLGITGPFGDIDEFQALALSVPSPTGRITYAAPFGLA